MLKCRATPESEGSDSDFDLSQFVEGKVFEVRHTERFGHIIFIKLQDGDAIGTLLPIYVGDAECLALQKEMSHRRPGRPMTHDLMKSTLELLGYQVTKVQVTKLVSNTYHARVHYAPAPGCERVGASAEELSVDARPSDAINLAVRFNAPIYIRKEVAAMMGQRMVEVQLKAESPVDIKRTCKDDILHYPDPTLHLQLELQLAIANDDFTSAVLLRTEIDRLLGSDRVLSLVVAIETALSDERYEEAARLRDELRELRVARHQALEADTRDASA